MGFTLIGCPRSLLYALFTLPAIYKLQSLFWLLLHQLNLNCELKSNHCLTKSLWDRYLAFIRPLYYLIRPRTLACALERCSGFKSCLDHENSKSSQFHHVAMPIVMIPLARRSGPSNRYSVANLIFKGQSHLFPIAPIIITRD